MKDSFGFCHRSCAVGLSFPTISSGLSARAASVALDFELALVPILDLFIAQLEGNRAELNHKRGRIGARFVGTHTNRGSVTFWQRQPIPRL